MKWSRGHDTPGPAAEVRLRSDRPGHVVPRRRSDHSIGLRSRRRFRNPPNRLEPVREVAGPALVERMLGVPLDGVRRDDVVRVERRAVVERHAVTTACRSTAVKSAFGSHSVGEERDRGGAADLVARRGLP